jgi:protein-arginine kinase activator protein McsA
VSGSPDPDEAPSETPSLSVFLRKELQTALDREDYERAALLRDQLAEIERHTVRRA